MPSSNTKILLDESPQDLHLELQSGQSATIIVVAIGRPAQHRIRIDLLGADAHASIYALCLSGSLHTDVRHMVPDTASTQLVKFILPAEQRGDFFGHLYIAPDAQRTDAQQTNRNLLLAPSAVMATRPQLEIYADDVRASHGASTGMLDTSALFYMQQRCIDPLTARRLLIGAFASEVLEQMEDAALRDAVTAQLDQVLQSVTD